MSSIREANFNNILEYMFCFTFVYLTLLEDQYVERAYFMSKAFFDK